MKVLRISRGGLEIGRTQLNKPLMVVGRSPTADLILRAPGVKPIHFLVEWVGAGVFNPNEGDWTALDISQATETTQESGEGVVLSKHSESLGSFMFQLIDDRLEPTKVIGGRIHDSVESGERGGNDLLELVQIRRDSGAIEDISHVRVSERARPRRVIANIPEFKVEFKGQDGQALVRVLLEEMPGASIFKQGLQITAATAAELSEKDLLLIKWKEFDFFMRLVQRVEPPLVATDPLRDPLLKKALLFVFLFAFLFLGGVLLMGKSKEEEPPPPVRVATVELKEVVPAPTPKPEPTPEKKPVEKVAEKPAPQKPPKPVPVEKVAKKPPEKKIEKKIEKEKPKVAGLKELAPVKKPGKAAAPRFNTPEGKPKLGLNSPAETKEPEDVNSVGLLGALKKSGAKGRGVRADQVFNEGIVTESVSAAEKDDSGIVVKNPLSGTLGKGTGGNPKGSDVGLGSAATTLRGAGQYDASSVGPIARRGGGSGYQLGTGLGDGGKGLGGGSEIGSLDSGEFSVEGGGLDRETVRRVIASYRGRVRTCYERALLSSPQLSGRVTYKWSISSDGPVMQAEILRANVNSSNLKACVLQVIREMRFPRAPNGLPTRVIYPFVFQPKS